MSAKGYIITLSLAGMIAALGGWMLKGKDEGAPQAPLAGSKRTHHRPVMQSPQASARVEAAKKPVAKKPAVPGTSSKAAGSHGLTIEQLAARAARVEQEANHDLRRLVELLDLDEVQQERVFQTLAQHSPSWVPGMQFAPPAGTAAAAGKRSEFLTGAPGLTPVPTKEPSAAIPVVPGTEAVADTDPMDEIMALLDPDQQDTLVQEELDRAAWWAEILEQITPPDEVPSVTPSVPSESGEVRIYEGTDVLE